MIDFLNGHIYSKSPTCVILEIQGIGYEVMIPLSTFDSLPPEGGKCRLLVHDHIREDAHILYGFATADERDFFRLLQNVTGIGPRTALGAISGMSIREIKRCIVERDTKMLSKLPGIGKKTAERIVVELHDKINPLEAMAAPEAELVSDRHRDAVLALMALGNTQETATKLVYTISQSPNPPEKTEDIIKLALSLRQQNP